jgi:hypothetical protein
MPPLSPPKGLPKLDHRTLFLYTRILRDRAGNTYFVLKVLFVSYGGARMTLAMTRRLGGLLKLNFQPLVSIKRVVMASFGD